MTATAVRIRYATHELKAIVWRMKDVEELPEGFSRELKIGGPEDFVRQLGFLFADLSHERFVVALLTSSNRIQAIEIVSEGILNASLVHPREVFRPAIVGCAASVILAHNHPSGNPQPSAEDVSMTKQLVEAGKIVGIPVHDHIIFAGKAYTSFVEQNLI